jgi:hypothetical protein
MTDTRMRCGCGFELAGTDATIEAFNEHVCTDVEPAPRWHESVFSLWGFMVLMALSLAIATLVSAR